MPQAQFIEKSKDLLRNPQWRLLFALLLILVVIVSWEIFMGYRSIVYQRISYSRFLEELQRNNIKEITIKDLEITGEFSKKVPVEIGKAKVEVKFFRTYLPSFQGEGLLKELQEKGVMVNVSPPERTSLFWQVLLGFLPWILFIGLWVYLWRRATMQGGPGGIYSFTSSKVRVYGKEQKPSVTFKDVAGLKQAKLELRETIEFLKNPDKFRKLGAKVPRGILLVGPPGTGKTLLARAVAGEAGVPFYSISASEFIEMFVGVGAARVRDVFKKAKENAPSIIFIDEIDAVGRTRGTGLGGGHDEREQTLNQLLSEMDGFEPHDEVIVIAATNRPDVLDPALLRPGRFDRHNVIDRPGLEDRKAILEVHTRGKPLGPDVDLEKIARGTPGMTGADLENLVNEAALIAIRKGKDRIDAEDFEEAKDKILMGIEREETISSYEKKITAYHEAGHALVAHELPLADPVYKVSIIPRGMAMGATQLLPEEDRHYYPKSYLMTKLAVMLGGRVAEKIVFNDVSSGAQNDLKEATSLAEKMVSQWGMSEKVGPINLGRGEEHPFLGKELAMPKHYSERMAWIMDKEIKNIVLEAEKIAEEILKKHRNALDALATALLEKETVEGDEIERIISEAKGGNNE